MKIFILKSSLIFMNVENLCVVIFLKMKSGKLKFSRRNHIKHNHFGVFG